MSCQHEYIFFQVLCREGKWSFFWRAYNLNSLSSNTVCVRGCGKIQYVSACGQSTGYRSSHLLYCSWVVWIMLVTHLMDFLVPSLCDKCMSIMDIIIHHKHVLWWLWGSEMFYAGIQPFHFRKTARGFGIFFPWTLADSFGYVLSIQLS